MNLTKNVIIIKKDGTKDSFNGDKIKIAVSKSANRVMITLSDIDKNFIVDNIIDYINKNDIGEFNSETGNTEIQVTDIHRMVEMSLEKINPIVCKSYKDYRNYKTEFIHILDDVYTKSQAIRYIGDKDNANTDSALVATKRCLIFNELNKELYRKFFMTTEELEACKEGYIYVHDQSARQDTFNCCIFNAQEVLDGGFEMGNIWYNEPKSLDTFFDVLGDLILSTAAQQYGGFTIPKIDELSEKYAHKSYDKHIKKYLKIIEVDPNDVTDEIMKKADKYAEQEITEEYSAGWKGLEYKLNTVGSSRGDYPFITVTLGLSKDRFGKICNKVALTEHAKGRGKVGHKIPTLFPKYVFLYTDELHGEYKELEDVFMSAIECSSKTMYPDYLSLDGDGYLAEMYHKYGEVISPMGCVDKDEKVTLMVDKIIYNITIKNLFDYLYDNYEVHHTTDGDEIYIDGRNIRIFDTKAGFVRLFRVIRRKPEYNKWMKITIGNPEVTKTITVTEDHPFDTVDRGLILAKDLTYDDRILVRLDDNSCTNCNVINKEYLPDKYDYSYDVTTESEHFEVSGIYSHNCRAFLSPWYERGGMYPADENDKPIFHGRFNIGVVSLNLPMILAKSRQESKDFYEVLDHYLEMIRNIHKRTFDYLGEMRASVNPIMFCEGGAYGGHLKPHDKLKSILKPMTASFGFTALNELQRLYNKKSIREDGEFALDVLRYINEKIEQFKKEDGILYAMYGTPAESLCSLQVTQFRKKYGIIENVSDRTYVSNSFHCHVSENMDPIEKQDKEHRFWDYVRGGRIQYVKYPISYNKKAIISLVRRAMKMNLYEGVNLSLAYCNECGHQQLEMDVCPKCGSKDLTKIDRMNGYLAFSRVHGDTRLNKGKMDEIADRVSM